MNEHTIPTPFSAPSWEPRFAIDGYRDLDGLVDLAISLHIRSSSSGWAYVEGEPVLSGYVVSEQRLALAAMLHGFPRPLRDAHARFENVDRNTAVEQVVAWLRSDAVYPDKPWFDGGEARGAQLFHVAWRQDIGPYGFLVVEPKWFEVHK